FGDVSADAIPARAFNQTQPKKQHVSMPQGVEAVRVVFHPETLKCLIEYGEPICVSSRRPRRPGRGGYDFHVRPIWLTQGPCEGERETRDKRRWRAAVGSAGRNGRYCFDGGGRSGSFLREHIARCQ